MVLSPLPVDAMREPSGENAMDDTGLGAPSKVRSSLPLAASQSRMVFSPFPVDAIRALSGENATMNYFAFFLSRILDLNVIDRTELPDHYDVKFHFVPDGATLGRGGAAAPPMPDGPDIFTALREQLGLRLEKGKGPVDYLVIEHVEKPSDN